MTVFDGVPKHPLADQFTCPTWDKPGACICGAALPEQAKWVHAGHDWQHVSCSECGRAYVDEEDYIAIYDEGLEDDGDRRDEERYVTEWVDVAENERDGGT